jgi:hypothetical protein
MALRELKLSVAFLYATDYPPPTTNVVPSGMLIYLIAPSSGNKPLHRRIAGATPVYSKYNSKIADEQSMEKQLICIRYRNTVIKPL